MEKVSTFRDLTVWQKSMGMVREVYDASRTFPRKELYGLTSQLRRAAISIPSNIAEGNARSSARDYLRHISIARGSLAELETQLLLAENLGYLPEEDLSYLLTSITEISRTLRALRQSLNKRLDPVRPSIPQSLNP